MMVDTTVYGLYIEDTGLVHNYADCAGDILYSADTQSYAIRGPEGELTNAQPLYSLDDTEAQGMSCDTCGLYIFEPDWRGILEQSIENILTTLPEAQALDAILELLADELAEVEETVREAVTSSDTTWRRAGRIVSELAEDSIETRAQETDEWERGY